MKFAKAICSGDGVPNLTLMIGGIKGRTLDPKVKLKDLKKLHSFHFDELGILAKKVAGIGVGSYILQNDDERLVNFKIDCEYDYEIVNLDQLENFRPKRSTVLPLKMPGEVEVTDSYEYDDEDEEEVDYIESNTGAIFSCPTPNCMSQFLRYDGLEKHLIAGQCKIKVESETIEEKVKTMYLSAFGIGFPEKAGKNEAIRDMVSDLVGYPEAPEITGITPFDTPLAPLATPKNRLFEMGFSLPMKVEKKRFSPEVIDFVFKIFEAGKRKSKATPEDVVQLMRRAKSRGKLIFQRKDWLTESQVKSLFGKFAAQQKKGEKITPESLDAVDIAEEEEQLNFQQAVAVANMTDEIIEKVQDDIPDIGDHPMIVNEINLCDLGKSIENSGLKVLKKVKVTEILEILDKIECKELEDCDFTGKGKKESHEKFRVCLLDFLRNNCCCML